jgi:serine protease inhibitor
MEPLEVRVDRPFLFAIQHLPTSACLFLGRITDPR